ncbi:unnamed protein product [Sphagnum jensenii]|uniref:Uncharacterized protein n=1 Tax=Sphagnum jensenii TaxID=128206 RepID=A0ABP0WWV7_9BRYO
MTVDSATTCGHEVTHLSSEGEPTMEMTMGFAVEDPTVAHDTAASPIHPDDNTDEVIELDLTMGEEVEAKDTEGAAGNQAIGK